MVISKPKRCKSGPSDGEPECATYCVRPTPSNSCHAGDAAEECMSMNAICFFHVGSLTAIPSSCLYVSAISMETSTASCSSSSWSMKRHSPNRSPVLAELEVELASAYS